ncbi:hypothetical protein UCD39_01120 [Nitrospirillum sp. BR 11752]|uniref:hypothetical protein n=1 Tax=Nitrospirillum sp. BR 11752 TaxID=3104293 RepID=UPI002EA2B7FE|nr:hypothetical protein [Nitrospirillum sp. BR 11752]
MYPHKFAIGQRAVLRPGPGETRPAGPTVSVTRQLPAEGRDPQYRIKVDQDGQERVVRESQLEAVRTPASA